MDQIVKNIELISVKPKREVSDYEIKNGQIKLCRVTVSYYEMQITGDLIKGKAENGKYYFFFSMPHFFFKLKNGKTIKKNYLKFPDKPQNDIFQLTVLRKIKELHPGFFEITNKHKNENVKEEKPR